jgi:hypothetical protein
MKGSYVGKPAGAKLLRLDLEWDGVLVVRASIRGDFFAHPEEGFDEAEAALAGVPVVELGTVLAMELAARGVTLFGLTPGDVGAAAAIIVASGDGGDA